MPTHRPRTTVIAAVVGLSVAAVAFGQTATSQQDPSKTPPPAAQPAAAAPAPPPSLSDLARAEAARRKGVKPARVYSDKDLKPERNPPATEGTATTEGAPAGDAAAEAGAAAGTETAKDTAKPESAKPEERGEQYWRTRMADAQETLRRNETFLEALQSRINALTADFTARDDPYQRAQIGDERQKALAELDRLTQEIEQNKKAIADIEDEARRAGVPAGWLR